MILREGGLRYGTCAQSKLYFCTKIYMFKSNQRNYDIVSCLVSEIDKIAIDFTSTAQY